MKLGAWHILPDNYHRSLSTSPLTSPGKLTEADYDRALCEHPTIIYLHGNAANRAAPFRTASYAQFTSRLQANVLAIDYRGFGDSEGTPSEDGLVNDAMAAWDWVQAKRSACKGSTLLPGEGVVFVGQSLGTGVGSKTVRRLTEAGTPPQALVLVAPYLSLRKIVAGYRIGGVIPILAPAMYIPYANSFLDWGLNTIFAQDKALPAIYAGLYDKSRGVDQSGQEGSGGGKNWPHLVMSHATDDEVIPYYHGEGLFEAIAQVLVDRRKRDKTLSQPAVDATSEADAAEQLQMAGLAKRLLAHDLVTSGGVQTRLVPHWARIERLFVGGSDGRGASVTLVRTESGGHNTVGEGIVDIVREVVAGDGTKLAFP